MELEKQVKQLKESASCERCEGLGDLAAAVGGKPSGDGLPKEPEKYCLSGHRDKINKVVVHPFYNIAATASDDASIRIWDFDQGELERTLKSHTGIVNGLAFSPNGQVLASASTDLTVKLWNMQLYTVQKTLQGHEHEVSGVAYMPSGDFLLSCSRD